VVYPTFDEHPGRSRNTRPPALNLP
jgi:hypothetical protein